MGLSVCLAANTLTYPNGGGHLWAYLNWALGLRALGCEVIWLEGVDPQTPTSQLQEYIGTLQPHLERYGLAASLALYSYTHAALPQEAMQGCLDLEAAAACDLLLNLQYGTSPEVVGRFRRSALLDIDPGLLQLWAHAKSIHIAPHNVYFTIGETVGQPEARFPDSGLAWQYTPPCVALDWWPQSPAAAGAAFTTVTHWEANEWMEDEHGELYHNDKRTGFLPFLTLPQHTSQPLELALCMNEDDSAWETLRAQGWRTCHAWHVSATPWDYQRYIQLSLGEFSCAKPSCIRLQNAWISDRTLCYLASGKPAIVQHTGPSRFLPENAGLFRFHNMQQATQALAHVATDYERQCQLARQLAREYFDARKVVKRVLEIALP